MCVTIIFLNVAVELQRVDQCFTIVTSKRFRLALAPALARLGHGLTACDGSTGLTAADLTLAALLS